MKKPILFNTEMVKAILEGRKTTTRRIVKGNVQDLNIIGSCSNDGVNFNYVSFGHGNIPYINNVNIRERIKAPYLPGDILWVRETWCDRWLPDGFLQGKDRYGYKADGIPSYGYWGNENQCKDNVWIPSIHMPKEAARMFLKVTYVRIERLQDITEEQAISEGIGDLFLDYIANCGDEKYKVTIEHETLAIDQFELLWNSTIKKADVGRYGWNANPWVWVIEFERVKK